MIIIIYYHNIIILYTTTTVLFKNNKIYNTYLHAHGYFQFSSLHPPLEILYNKVETQTAKF